MSNQQPKPVAESWPAGWQKRGWNGCMECAADALRFLASHERPSGGEQEYNAEHLLQIAGELKKTQNELLGQPAATIEELQRELIAWRVRYTGQEYQAGVGIVPIPKPTDCEKTMDQLSSSAIARALEVWDQTAKHVPTMADEFKRAFQATAGCVCPAITGPTLEAMYQAAWAART